MSPFSRSPTWIALALALSGCGGKVVIDGDISSETSGTPETVNALLVTKLDPNGLCSLHADQNQPGAVFLYVASQPITCAKPDLFSPSKCPPAPSGPPYPWEICIPIQPELAPKTLDFHSYGGYANFVSVAPDCASVWGTLQQGTISIAAVDPSTVTFTLAGTDVQQTVEMTSDGAYEALRCP